MLKIILISTFFLSSCSLLYKSDAQEKLYTNLSRDGYPLNLKDLQKKVDSFLSEGDEFKKDSELIILNTSGIGFSEAQDDVRDDLNDGFTYKNKLYETTQEIGWDLIKGNIDNIKDKLFKAKYHLIEDTTTKFIFVKNDRFYLGESTSNTTSKLRVFQITKAVKPTNVNLDWINLLRKKGSLLNFSEGVVDMESSMLYKVQDRIAELDLYFRFMPVQSRKQQAELLKK